MQNVRLTGRWWQVAQTWMISWVLWLQTVHCLRIRSRGPVKISGANIFSGVGSKIELNLALEMCMKAEVSWEYLSSPQSAYIRLQRQKIEMRLLCSKLKFHVVVNLLGVFVFVVVMYPVAEKSKKIVHPELHILDPISAQCCCC